MIFWDMTLTSPPYDDLLEYNGYHFPFERDRKPVVSENETRSGVRGVGDRRPHIERKQKPSA